MENFRRQWNLDRIIVTKILRCFRTSRYGKWRDRFKLEKFVFMVAYFEQQTDCSRYRIKYSQSGRKPSWRNQSRLPFLKWKPCHGAINSLSRNLRTALEKYFRFDWNCKQLRVEARSSISNCEICFPIFSETLHNYTYNFENIFP